MALKTLPTAKVARNRTKKVDRVDMALGAIASAINYQVEIGRYSTTLYAEPELTDGIVAALVAKGYEVDVHIQPTFALTSFGATNEKPGFLERWFGKPLVNEVVEEIVEVDDLNPRVLFISWAEPAPVEEFAEEF